MDIDLLEAGPDLAALVATKVMGWQVFTEQYGDDDREKIHYWCSIRTKETHPDWLDEKLAAYPLQDTGWLVYDPPKDRDVPKHILASAGCNGVFRPDLDIRAVWAVVEKLLAMDLDFAINSLTPTGLFDDLSPYETIESLECKRLPWKASITTCGRYYDWITASGETAPLAICRVALKAVEAEL